MDLGSKRCNINHHRPRLEEVHRQRRHWRNSVAARSLSGYATQGPPCCSPTASLTGVCHTCTPPAHSSVGLSIYCMLHHSALRGSPAGQRGGLHGHSQGVRKRAAGAACGWQRSAPAPAMRRVTCVTRQPYSAAPFPTQALGATSRSWGARAPHHLPILGPLHTAVFGCKLPKGTRNMQKAIQEAEYKRFGAVPHCPRLFFILKCGCVEVLVGGTALVRVKTICWSLPTLKRLMTLGVCMDEGEPKGWPVREQGPAPTTTFRNCQPNLRERPFHLLPSSTGSGSHF